MDLKKVGKQYEKPELDENELLDDPIQLFKNWMQLAVKTHIPYANAANLCTVGADGFPQTRIILIKEILNDGISFFTNYRSAKAKDIQQNPKVALNVYWKELDRQVRFTGTATKTPPEESKSYFFSRPRPSQISAIASPQSQEISKEELYSKVKEIELNYKDKSLDYPEFWGGYYVQIQAIEFWQGRPDRLHDRFIYLKSQEKWLLKRLAP